MSRTQSKMVPLGTVAPGFVLPDTRDGSSVTFPAGHPAAATVVMFLCNHCPYVKHVQRELPRLATEYQARGVDFYAISSNDADAYPDDGPAQMREEGLRMGYSFPYLYDETQEVARAYDAACTPDFYVFDRSLKLVYRGQLDDSRRDNGVAVTGRDLRAALDAVLGGQPVSYTQVPSLGCNIKWKP